MSVLVLLLFLYILILSIYKEREMLGCMVNGKVSDIIKNVFTMTPKCDNSQNEYSKMILSTPPSDPFTIYSKIVIWRRCFILSTIIIGMYHILIGCPFDTSKIFMAVILGMIVLYLSFNFYTTHLLNYINADIKKMYTIELNKK